MSVLVVQPVVVRLLVAAVVVAVRLVVVREQRWVVVLVGVVAGQRLLEWELVGVLVAFGVRGVLVGGEHRLGGLVVVVRVVPGYLSYSERLQAGVSVL